MVSPLAMPGPRRSHPVVTRGRRPTIRVERADGARDAVSAALRMAAPGDVVLVLYEKADPMLALLTELGAVPAEADVVTPRHVLLPSR